tara:strand:- start:1763 stop:3172 length:1410 start_codon:yes stop_codon:yes gene_type:complete
MGISNHINIIEVLNTTSGQNLLRLKPDVESEPLRFLQELYTSPPKINIAWQALETQRTACGIDDHQLVPSKIPTTSIGNRLNRNRSGKFLNRYTEKIKNSLQSVPVYVLVNGRNELVVATTKPVKCPGSELLSKPNRQKFGFIFLDKREADLYLDEITQKVDATVYTQRTTGLSQIGLSVHCVGLDYAYNLFRNSPDVDFRFIPNLNQVNYILENINPSEISKFVQYQQPLKVDLPGDLYRDEDNLMLPDVESALIDSFKGVPIYVVQLKDIPSDIVQKNMLKVSGLDNLHPESLTFNYTYSSITEKVSPSILNSFPNFIDQEFSQSVTQDSSAYSNNSERNLISNYVFFNKVQADQFSVYCSQYLLKDINFVSSTKSAQVFSLEGFLEMWEDAIILKKDFNEGKFSFNSEQPTYFIPSNESLKVLKDYATRPKNSLIKSVSLWAQSKLVKLRWLQHDYLGLILRGYRL